MSDFDKYLRDKAKSEKMDIPGTVKERIDKTLDSLPEINTHISIKRSVSRLISTAACFVFITLFLLPNLSHTYAKALEKIPVIDDIVRVVTIRNYFYSDDYHEMNIDVPELEDKDEKVFDLINKDIGELTDVLVHDFYETLEVVGNSGHGSIYVDYEMLTDTERWFTLKIRVVNAAGSGNTYYKYYNVDKLAGKIVTLGDMALSDSFFSTINGEINRQMKLRMENNSDEVYWTDDSDMGTDVVSVSSEHNFYWNEQGELVIPFDKYEVAPGYMGTPEFAITGDVTDGIIKEEFKNIMP